MRVVCFALSWVLLLATSRASADERPLLPSVFGDGMVLQRDASVPVWGFAAPGSVITVRFADQRVEAKADASGRWSATLAAMPASFDGRELTIDSAGGASRTIRDVLVGDVFLLGGQSNMGFQLDRSAGAAKAKAQATYPWLRVFQQAPGKGAADERRDDVTEGSWSVCTPENAGKMSGVGFFFARELHPHVDVPIALVHTALGGTRIESWIDRPTLDALPGVDAYRQAIARAEARFASEEAAYKVRLAEWEKTKQGRWPDFPNLLGVGRQKRPSALFYGKIAPLQPMALRGVLWYQGEGNPGNDPAYYEAALQSLIRTWRRDFAQPELPFLIVQLPNWGKGEQWPGTREAQRRVARSVPQTGLIVTLDLGDPNDLHPANKLYVGARAARLARAMIYRQDIVATGPVARSARLVDDRLIVQFEHAGKGLRVRDGELVRGFEVRDAAGTFIAVEGRVSAADEVTLNAPNATAVRYAWSADPKEANLLNSDALPAATFLLDAVPTPP
jgi:sialate O-acetylesterase